MLAVGSLSRWERELWGGRQAGSTARGAALPPWLALLACMLVLVSACEQAPAAPAGGPSPTPTPGAEATELWTVLATTDLGVGSSRFAFVLSDRAGLIRFPIVNTEAYFYPQGYEADREGPLESRPARFEEFPLGIRGIYVSHYSFDRPGAWGLEVAVPRADGSVELTEVRFPVRERTAAPAVGDRPPPSVNRTFADVASLDELTTGTEPDPELYRMTVAEALESSRPFVVVFASPAFCTTAVCGPQVEVLSELREQFADRVDFIHVDLYDNPHEIQGDLDRAVRSPILEEWGIETDEWTFVVGRDGLVNGRFEGFAPIHELRETLQALLEDDVG